MQQCQPDQPRTSKIKEGKQRKQERLKEKEWEEKVVKSEASLRLADHIPSPLYAAPELYQGSGYSMSGDLWSLGCVVCEMLTGRQPFSCHASPDALEAAICHGCDGGMEMGRWDGEGGDSSGGGEWEAWSEMVHGLLDRTLSQR